MSKITYRFAVPGDIETLVKLRLAFLAEGGKGSAHDSRLADSIRKYFSTLLPHGEFVAALAEDDGVIVGTSGMVFDRHPPRLNNPTGISPYIMNMYVLPEYRRRGIATKLLLMLVARARETEAQMVTLHFWPGKSALYAKIGFAPVETEMKLEL